jgi:hypothetical protein
MSLTVWPAAGPWSVDWSDNLAQLENWTPPETLVESATD